MYGWLRLSLSSLITTTPRRNIWFGFSCFKCRLFLEVHETEIREMFGVADHDNNGHIGFKEFMVRPFFLFFKGQCHEIFCFRFLSWIIFPQAPENNIRVISNFFEHFWRYSQVKVHHRYQRHRGQILPPVPPVFLIPVANLPPESTIPAANLPLVSTKPVANNGNNIRLLKP